MNMHRDRADGCLPRVEGLEGRRLLANSIKGIVFNDADADGRRDSGEAVVANRRVFLDANFNNRYDSREASAVTNSKGEYTFKNLRSGIFRVALTPAEGWRTTTPSGARRDVPLTFNQRKTVDFGVTDTVEIRGRVFDDRNGNRRRDVSERGLRGWTVYIDDNNNGKLDDDELIAETNSSGDYRFRALAKGTYRIRVDFDQDDFRLTTPQGGSYRVQPKAGEIVVARDFGVRER